MIKMMEMKVNGSQSTHQQTPQIYLLLIFSGPTRSALASSLLPIQTISIVGHLFAGPYKVYNQLNDNMFRKLIKLLEYNDLFY